MAQTISDLPDELLYQILADLSPDDCFNLSLLCRRLHFFCLPIFLASHNVQDASSAVVVVVELSASQMKVVRALHISLLTKSIRKFACAFSTPNSTDATFREVNLLERTLERFTGLEETTLDFRGLCYWDIGVDENELEKRAENITRLLSSVVDRGCKKLALFGGRLLFSTVFTARSPKPAFSFFRSLKLTSRTKKAVQPQKDVQIMKPETVSTERRSQLEVLIIESPMFASPVFSPWLSRLVSSSSIHTLVLGNMDNPSQLINPLLEDISIPNLVDFTLNDCNVEWLSVLDFLERHVAITTLRIKGDQVRNNLPPRRPRVLHLNKLTTLSGCPRCLSLISSPGTEVSTLLVHSLTIEESILPYSRFHAWIVNQKLRRIPQSMINRVQLTIRFLIDCSGHEWLEYYEAHRHAEFISRRATTVYIGSQHHHPLCTTEAGNPTRIPDWLAFHFPVVEEVVFERGTLSWLTSDRRERLVRMIKDACPSVKNVTISEAQASR